MAVCTVATACFPTKAPMLNTIPVNPCWPRSPATCLNLPMIDSRTSLEPSNSIATGPAVTATAAQNNNWPPARRGCTTASASRARPPRAAVASPCRAPAPGCPRPPPTGTAAGQGGPPGHRAPATPSRVGRCRGRREPCSAWFFVSTSAGAVSLGMLLRRDRTSAFQRFRLSVIFAKRYFRLLFSRLAALHLLFHRSRLHQKNRSNLEIGLRNGNDSPIDIGSPPCNLPRIPVETRPPGHNTKLPPMEQNSSRKARSVFPERSPGFHPSTSSVICTSLFRRGAR